MSAPEPTVSVVVVSYNTKEMTLECLRSVCRETSVPYQLIVVDNASTDGSPDAIAQEFPDVDFLREPENFGFALANNKAITEYARGEYVLLLNPDTVVLDGAIDKVVAFARANPMARIWGGRTLFGDRSLNPTSCWRRLTLWNV
ncbi:MAG: glycosyltransferase family 2 protein, partial [Pseudomonadota bacterium]